MFVVNGHVVIVPSWPIASDAIVMTLAIDESVIMDDGTITEGGQMPEIGKFRFCSDEAMTTIDENWEHTQLRVVRDMAMVVIRSPNWQCLVVKVYETISLYKFFKLYPISIFLYTLPTLVAQLRVKTQFTVRIDPSRF